jgi:hypothetical protein
MRSFHRGGPLALALLSALGLFAALAASCGSPASPCTKNGSPSGYRCAEGETCPGADGCLSYACKAGVWREVTSLDGGSCSKSSSSGYDPCSVPPKNGCDCICSSNGGWQCFPCPTGGTGSGGVGGGCAGIVVEPAACSDCTIAHCCKELADCSNDPNSDCGYDCLTAPIGPYCGNYSTFAPLWKCETTYCKTECPMPQNTCNPVTGEGCALATEVCDYAGDYVFQCRPVPGTVSPCKACDYNKGPVCAAGSTCWADGKCAHYCCDNADCGSGACVAVLPGIAVGVCLGGGDAGAMGSTCDAPAKAPSGGSCFTLGGGGAGGAGGGPFDAGADADAAD